MAPAVYETTSVQIRAVNMCLPFLRPRILFDGFHVRYTRKRKTKKRAMFYPESWEEGMTLHLKELVPEQHFTQPPAHYTEASLVKTMEELGIGRPSTYAPTITTIISRRYVSRSRRICM